MNGTYLTNNRERAALVLSNYCIDREVYKELCEPIFFDNGDALLYNTRGILIFNEKKLKILYIKKEYRNSDEGSYLISEMILNLQKSGIKEIFALCPVGVLEFYIKNGFKEHGKRFKNYANIKINLDEY